MNEQEEMALSTSTAYTAAQNGGAERAWRTTKALASSMMLDSGMPMEFWWLAFRDATHIHNRLAARRHGWMSPIKLVQDTLRACLHLNV
jgi:hypothetical protein